MVSTVSEFVPLAIRSLLTVDVKSYQFIFYHFKEVFNYIPNVIKIVR